METKNFNHTVKENSSSSLFGSGILQNSTQNIDWQGTLWTLRRPSCPNKIVKIGTSCSGIGAMEHALNQMGINTRIEFAGDKKRIVKKSYFANYPITEDRWHKDIFEFAESDLSRFYGKISMFMAGICCQPFSTAGLLKGIDDPTRGTLFEPFKKIIEKIQPRVWILENVDNMLYSNNGRDWKIIKENLDKLEYDIHFQVLNALDYGVPQHRKRLFVIGFKEQNPDFKFPAPLKHETCIYDILQDTSPALRRLTPREALRLQGFSDDFRIVVSDRATYNQAGNSIAVPVLKALFSQMDITKYGF